MPKELCISDMVITLDIFAKAGSTVLTKGRLESITALVKMYPEVVDVGCNTLSQAYYNTLKAHYDFLTSVFDLVEETVTSKKFVIKKKVQGEFYSYETSGVVMPE